MYVKKIMKTDFEFNVKKRKLKSINDDIIIDKETKHVKTSD